MSKPFRWLGSIALCGLALFAMLARDTTSAITLAIFALVVKP